MLQKVPISSIKISARVRKTLGGIPELAANIREYGLISPIVINKDYKLLAGERRLEACRSLGWTEIDAIIKETTDAERELCVEISENEFRQGFTREELINAGIELERIERVKAEERMLAGKANPKENFPEGQTRDIVAAKLGMSGKQYEREKFIVQNRELLSPGEFADWNSRVASTNKTYKIVKDILESLTAPKKTAPQEQTPALSPITNPIVKEVEVAPPDYENNKAQLARYAEKNVTLEMKLESKDEEIAELRAQIEQLRSSGEPDAELRRQNEELLSRASSQAAEITRLKRGQYSGPVQEADVSYAFSKSVADLIQEYTETLLYGEFFRNNCRNDCENRVTNSCQLLIDFCRDVLKRQTTDTVIDVY